MSNYLPVDYQSAPLELREIYDEICLTMNVNEPPSWATCLGGATHLVKGMWAMLKHCVVESHLPPLLKELIFFAVAYHRTVPYCMDIHAKNILRMTKHLTYCDLKDIVENKSRGVIPNSYQVAINLATKLSKSECSLQKADFKLLEKAGFDDVESMEIATQVSAALYFNVLTFAADLPVPNYLKNDRQHWRESVR